MRRRRCPQCGRGVNVTSHAVLCYACRRPSPGLASSRVSILEQGIPGREERIAKYAERAAKRLPLFSEG